MNNYSRVMGRWLFHPYQCHVCKQKMMFDHGMRVDQKSNTMIHKACEKK